MDKLKGLFSGSKHESNSRTSSSQPQHDYDSNSQAPPSYQQPPQHQQQQQSAPQTSQQPRSSAGTGSATTGGRVPPGKTQGVLMTTNAGDITIILFSDQTPKTCQNFAGLADSGFYNGVVFHRIIRDFMIQGGDPTGTGRGGQSIWGGKFEDEFDPNLKHSGKGILSMANSGPATNGSQFFITLAPTPHLNGKHTVFGQVVGGMEVVDMIGDAQTDGQDRPLQEIKIIKAESFLVDDEE